MARVRKYLARRKNKISKNSSFAFATTALSEKLANNALRATLDPSARAVPLIRPARYVGDEASVIKELEVMALAFARTSACRLLFSAQRLLMPPSSASRKAWLFFWWPQVPVFCSCTLLKKCTGCNGSLPAWAPQSLAFSLALRSEQLANNKWGRSFNSNPEPFSF